MNRIQHSDLSIKLDKQQLDRLIKGVLSVNYSIFWGFDKGKMILNIYSAEANHKLTMIKHKQFLELIEVDIKTDKMLQTLDQWVSISSEIKRKQQEDKKRRSQEIYRRIDQYLIELNDFMKSGDERTVEIIKSKLTELNKELLKLKQNE
ncbi:hypothetical protein BTR23_00215 [Alkalihalophilus pseudofirmus]|uniref:hypothetical protein n=1 Tax=Alkalihalobacterium alkalinitrilicum TaxID=427920 RepID=UPI00094CC528|nr:hypothetical protein [Alkalihalobacterium alkalinitrilicum]OLO42480.1 hypothetical protein BTR23_00215 [Alkalihalophilus pseudofirmus]